MSIFTELMEMFWFQALIKILLGGLLTGIIGLERSSLNKPAGFGTHAILGVSAVLVVLVSEYLSIYNDIDMSRIPAQLLSGIGFIGAGTILRNGFNVKGVTTAAGILSVTCIGLAVGAGFYSGAIISTIVVYLILAYSHNISDKFERFTDIDLKITLSKNYEETFELIKEYITKKNIEIKGIKRENEFIEIVGDFESRFLKVSTIIQDIISIENVKEVSNLEE